MQPSSGLIFGPHKIAAAAAAGEICAREYDAHANETRRRRRCRRVRNAPNVFSSICRRRH